MWCKGAKKEQIKNDEKININSGISNIKINPSQFISIFMEFVFSIRSLYLPKKTLQLLRIFSQNNSVLFVAHEGDF